MTNKKRRIIMFRKNPDALFVCRNCGEGFSIRNLERHIKEAHFWENKFEYLRR